MIRQSIIDLEADIPVLILDIEDVGAYLKGMDDSLDFKPEQVPLLIRDRYSYNYEIVKRWKIAKIFNKVMYAKGYKHYRLDQKRWNNLYGDWIKHHEYMVFPNYVKVYKSFRKYKEQINAAYGIEDLSWPELYCDSPIDPIQNTRKYHEDLQILLVEKRTLLVSLKRNTVPEGGDTGAGDKNPPSKPTLFIDTVKNIVFTDKNKRVKLEPRQIKLIIYLSAHKAIELNQIIVEHFETPIKSLGFDSKRNTFDNSSSTINKACETLGIGKIIIPEGTVISTFMLRVNVKKEKYNINQS